MKIGSRQIINESKGRLRMKDMQLGEKWVIHVVNGPIARVSQLWPTVEEDSQTHVLKPTWRSAYVKKDEPNLLDKLAALDVQLKRKHAMKTRGLDEKTAAKEHRKSALSKNERFDYAVIRHNTGEPLKVEIMETLWTVHSAIQTIKNAQHPTNPTVLHHGLPYMYLLVLEKTLNQKTKQNAYNVSIMNCVTEGKIPIQYLDETKNPFPQPEQFFTPEELAAIEACTWDLENVDLPISAEEVATKLAEWPIDLSRNEYKKDDTFMFFSSKEDLVAIMSFSQANQIHVTRPSDQDLLKLNAAPMAGSNPVNNVALPPGGAGSGNNAVDASFTVVPDEQPAPIPAATVAPQFTAPAATPVTENPFTVNQPVATAVPPVSPGHAPALAVPSFTPPAAVNTASAVPPVASAQPAAANPGQTAPPANTPPAFKKPNLW